MLNTRERDRKLARWVASVAFCTKREFMKEGWKFQKCTHATYCTEMSSTVQEKEIER